jgi:hypothetical protein
MEMPRACVTLCVQRSKTHHAVTVITYWAEGTVLHRTKQELHSFTVEALVQFQSEVYVICDGQVALTYGFL